MALHGVDLDIDLEISTFGFLIVTCGQKPRVTKFLNLKIGYGHQGLFY